MIFNMKISSDLIEKIYYEQLKIILEDKEIFSSEKFSEDSKMLLIASEFFVRLFDSIIESFKNPSNISTSIDSILKDPEYNKILNVLSNFTSVNKNMEFIKDTILNGNKYLTEFARNIRGIKLTDPKMKLLIFGDQQQSGFIKDIVAFKKVLDKMLITARKLFDYSGNSADYEKKHIPPQILEAVSELEKTAASYLSEVEALFQKLHSIADYMQHKNLKLKDYPQLQSANLAQQILDANDELHNDFSKKEIPELSNKSKFDYFAKGEVYGFKKDAETQEFSIKKFLKSLYKKEFSESSVESKRAFIIHRIIEILRSYESSVIPRVLKKAHGALWDPSSKKYYHNTHVFTIYNAFQQGRNQTILQFPKILKIMDVSVKNGESTEEFLTKNLPLIETTIKWVQFWKVNIKNAFLSIVSGEKAQIDPHNVSNDYSKEKKAEIQERLFYWNLFKKLGWTSDDAPTWLYK